MTNRQLFLDRFKTLCKVYNLTYSEAIFHPFRWKGRVELEFILSGYRLCLIHFNSEYADSYIDTLTTFAENSKAIAEEDKGNLDIVMMHFHKEFSYHAKYSTIQLEYGMEYEMWEQFYRENNEDSKPFYLEQDLDVLDIEEIGFLAEEYEDFIAERKRYEEEVLIPFLEPQMDEIVDALAKDINEKILEECMELGNEDSPREPRFSVHEAGIPLDSLLTDEQLNGISRISTKIDNQPVSTTLRPRQKPLEERFLEATQDRASTTRHYTVEIPVFHSNPISEQKHKEAVKEKFMKDFSEWLEWGLRIK
jgi:hypothetical protein